MNDKMPRFKIVSETTVYEFIFFADGTICQGAVVHNSLYKLIAEYCDSEPLQALTLACSLEQQGMRTIVSVKVGGTRKVWAEIRSLINPVPLL